MTIRPTFKPAFFAADTFNSISGNRPAQQTDFVLFSDAKYHGMSMQQFMTHPDFAKCQQEYAALVDHIVAFVRNNADQINPKLSPDTIEKTQKHFAVLKSHLSNLQEDFFSAHKPVVYGPGKEMFHELENLLGNAKISLQKRMDAVMAMAPQMEVCSGGMLTVLQEAVSSLKYSTAGIKGAAYRLKIQMIDALITQHVQAAHHYEPGNEVHFVNLYFNYIAKDLGVPERIDKFISIAERVVSVEQFEKCKQTVLAKLDPGLLAKAMADNYLSQVKDAQPSDAEPSFEGQKLTDVFNRTNDLKNATLDSEFGEVPTESYLLPIPDTLSYQFARQGTLIAKHFMEELKKEQLVDYNDTISLTAEGENGAIKMLGDLFWRDCAGACEELKAEELLDVLPTTILHMLNQQGLSQEEQDSVFQGIMQHILDTHEVENIQHIPDAWLQGYAGLFRENKITANAIVPAVMLATTFNNQNGLQALINAGAEINAKNPQGFTAAMLAVQNGHEGVLKKLLDAGANLQAQDSQGYTVTMLAAKKGQEGVLEQLIAALRKSFKELSNFESEINAASTDGYTATMLAAQNGHAGVLEQLIAAGADIHAKGPRDYTAAMLAAEEGHEGVLKQLIAKGAHVNVTNTDGFTPTMLAAQNGHAGALKQLIDALKKLDDSEAHLNAVDEEGYTAVMLAAQDGHAATLKQLIAAGADIRGADTEGFTAVMLAAHNGHDDALEDLIDALKKLDDTEAHLNAVEVEGYTAAMLAAENGHANALKLLIEAKADMNVQGPTGYTAAMLAAENGHVEALKILAKADMNAQGPNGYTAAMLAAKNGHANALKVLIAAGANIELVNHQGLTAAMLAKQKGHADILQVINEAKNQRLG